MERNTTDTRDLRVFMGHFVMLPSIKHISMFNLLIILWVESLAAIMVAPCFRLYDVVSHLFAIMVITTAIVGKFGERATIRTLREKRKENAANRE